MKRLFNRLSQWFSTPKSPNLNSKNFLNVQIDGIGVGLASAATPFLPVFLTRLGASNLQVGLLTSMPAITGFITSIPLGAFLQSRSRIIPWFSTARLIVILSYAATGVVTIFLPENASVISILFVWALATIPQTIVAISFSVVMNAVAGPEGRFELMSRRWSILGTTTALSVLLVGFLLDNIAFPTNYQLAFIILSIGGFISFYFSSHLDIPSQQRESSSVAIFQLLRGYFTLVIKDKPFIQLIIKRFVFYTGINFALPLFPLYFVRELHASDSMIATISTAQTAILILGYFLWTRLSRKRGSRAVLLWTTFGLSLYPILTGLTHQVWLIPIFAGMAGIFQAGLNLVFFDELMKRIPPEYSATYVSMSQSFEYIAAIAAPLIGTLIANQIGLGMALIIGGSIRLAGFLLFLFGKSIDAS